MTLIKSLQVPELERSHIVARDIVSSSEAISYQMHVLLKVGVYPVLPDLVEIRPSG